MKQDLTKFEEESTKSPILLPIIGVVVFLLVGIMATVCTGKKPAPPDDGQQQAQGQ